MPSASEKSSAASRHPLELGQTNLINESDPRFFRLLTDYETTKFAFQWAVTVFASILPALFIRFAFLSDNWHCLATVLAAVIVGLLYGPIDRGLNRYFDHRIDEVIPANLRGRFQRTS